MKFLFLLAFCYIGAVHAETKTEPQQCSGLQTQLEFNECTDRVWEKADKELAVFEANYIQRLAAQQRALYQSAYTAWVAYRQASCEFESSGVLGGSAYPETFARCMSSKATSRLQELRRLAACSEGDYACPVSSAASVPNNSFNPTAGVGLRLLGHSTAPAAG
jgi:uncharacterized protein YecT (DUF1311 family)